MKSFAIGLLLGAVALAIILPTVAASAGNGRYSFTPYPEYHQVLIGDTRTGQAWQCVHQAALKEAIKNGDAPEDFSGCHAIVNPAPKKR